MWQDSTSGMKLSSIDASQETLCHHANLVRDMKYLCMFFLTFYLALFSVKLELSNDVCCKAGLDGLADCPFSPQQLEHICSA